MHAGVYLSLGSTNITTNNTEILITDIGEDAVGGLPSLICHTDLVACCTPNETMGTGLGLWRYPNGDRVLGGSASISGFRPFISLRNFQFIKLVRRERFNPPPLSPTGSYCCNIPTTGGEMTFCANLGECMVLRFYSIISLPCSCVPVSPSPEQWSSLIQQSNAGFFNFGHLHL